MIPKAFLEKWVTFTYNKTGSLGVFQGGGWNLRGKVHPLEGFLVHSQISVEHRQISTVSLGTTAKNQDSSDLFRFLNHFWDRESQQTNLHVCDDCILGPRGVVPRRISISSSHVSYTKKRWAPAKTIGENPRGFHEGPGPVPPGWTGTVTPKGRVHSNQILPKKTCWTLFRFRIYFIQIAFSKMFFSKKKPNNFTSSTYVCSSAMRCCAPGCPGFTFSPSFRTKV